MRSFRKAIFWVHLGLALSAGAVIFIMCATGALLAFERNIIELSESDVRAAALDSGEKRSSPLQVLESVKLQRPELKPSALSISSEPGSPWAVSMGRDGQIFVDPFTGAVRGDGNKAVRSAMSELRSWHRYVALSGDNRPVGKLATGISNIVFLFLAVSGIYIWFPRKLEWKRIRPVIWFRRGLKGKGRNFNWHNVIGFWTSLFLIIFTLTATAISFQWAGNLLYTFTGNEVPQQNAQTPAPRSYEEATKSIPSNIDSLWSAAELNVPEWRSISLRLPVDGKAAVFTINEGIYWNRFGRSTLTLDAASGEVIKWEAYGEQNSARQLRSWFRFSHTGESAGLLGQFIGFAACLGGCFLVWTGFSLALRRFRNWLARRRSAFASGGFD